MRASGNAQRAHLFTSPKKQPVGSANVAPTGGLRGRETLPRRLGELVHWVRKGVHVCVGVRAWPCLHYKIPTILPRPLGSSWPTLLSSIASWRFVSFPTFLGHGCPLSGRPTPWFALGLLGTLLNGTIGTLSPREGNTPDANLERMRGPHQLGLLAATRALGFLVVSGKLVGFGSISKGPARGVSGRAHFHTHLLSCCTTYRPCIRTHITAPMYQLCTHVSGERY